MRRLLSCAFALFVFAQFAGCLSVSEAVAAPQPRSQAAADPQAKPQAPRLARLYFLRERGLWNLESKIKINGQLVGSVSKGHYFVVSRPPGRYRLTCVNPLAMDFEADLQVEGGRTYYFGVGVPQGGPPAQALLNHVVNGSSGQQMSGTSPLMSGFSAAVLYQIDATQGPAIISEMKPK